MVLKESLQDPLWQFFCMIVVFAVGLLLLCVFLLWPEHDKAMIELHKMPCIFIKQSVLGIPNNFWLHPEDYSQELATRCSK